MKKLTKISRWVFVTGVFLAGVFYRSWVPDLAWLRIKEVVVRVEPPITDQEVRAALPKLIGKNLLLTPAEDLIQKVLENPWVASAVVKKEYPNRLVLTVQSRRPVAAKQIHNQLMIVDEAGNDIDKWSAVRAAGFDLPVIAFEKPEHAKIWSLRSLTTLLAGLQKAIPEKYRISQLVPVDPPYFKVFLSAPSLETLFSIHTWEEQLPLFLDVLSRPPRQIGQAHKINLVFPKKAVVSFPLSH